MPRTIVITGATRGIGRAIADDLGRDWRVLVGGRDAEAVAAVVAEQYGVTVKNVATSVQASKAVRFARGKNRYPGTTNRSDSKKAYVTLAEGSKLAIFEQPAEEAKSEEKK